MNLKEFASPLKSKNSFIKASIGGMAGSGKTYTATSFIIGCYKDMGIKKPILIIDNEKGSRFLTRIFQKEGIETFVKETIYLPDVLQAFELLNKGEIGFLFIDSLTKIWYQYVKDYKKKNGNKVFMTLQDWGKILPAWQDEFSDRFVDLSGSCVFTGRGGYTYDMEETKDEASGRTKKEFVRSGVKMKLAGETPFEPDLNIWMELEQDIIDGQLKQWREAQILKDRSQIIDGKIFKNPTYEDFKPVIQFLLSIPIGEVKGATDKTNLAPGEDYAKYEQRDQKEIELEKIQAIFDLQKFSPQSKEDKSLKLKIVTKFFGTTSQTEIEKKSFGVLHNARVDLEKFFVDYNTAPDKEIYIDDYVIGDEKPVVDKNNPLGL